MVFLVPFSVMDMVAGFNSIIIVRLVMGKILLYFVLSGPHAITIVHNGNTCINVWAELNS